MPRIRCALLAVIGLVVTSAPLRGADAAMSGVANQMIEVGFTSEAVHDDPFNQVTLDVNFTDPSGLVRRVPAFWAGGKSWRVRYASGAVGSHTFQSECSDPADKGLHGVRGTVTIAPYKGDNPLFVHGPPRAGKGKRYLEYADGTPFFWLGDTWWMGLTDRLKWPEEFQKLTADRVEKGFTVVQIVAGLYPDMPAFDPRGANEAGFPWEKEYPRIRPEYFDAADRRMFYLVEKGISPCVVGAWGYHLPWLGVEKMKQHQRYVYARWGALPMIWCVAGELNLPFYLTPGFPNHGEAQTADWEKVFPYVNSINCFGRAVSAHPTGIPPMSIRGVLKDPDALGFDMLQTPHGQMDVLPTTVNTVRYSYGKTPILATVNAEPSYEMLFDKTPAAVVRRVFWECWENGVKGYTYGANGIWQLNRHDRPYGNSPWGGGYGKISWDEAMNLDGSRQVALGKKLMQKYAWQQFEPHPSWATAKPTPVVDVALGDWIWSPEGDATIDAPVGPRYFRRSFDLPAISKVKSAALHITADDMCEVWLNGQSIGSHANHHQLAAFDLPLAALKPGKNLLAVRGVNGVANVPKNPAGLICGLRVELADGNHVDVPTDAEWRVASAETPNWKAADFDDASWAKARVHAHFGEGPWGKPALDDKAGDGPSAMGIAKQVRIIYVPSDTAIVVHEIEAGQTYQAAYWDPTTGEQKDLGKVTASGKGDWACGQPSYGHDWVLLLDAAAHP